ncbi:FKBP-type peptidyl-prolyl cis-trans isomerase [Terriglobus saanensis]|uniref:Peptidyl-prolyl cis-trans isomerase n=1 Tax=Terriglobus saanensis (strain ATCC BAA-1853 / DSM 23119 / SP1PR4) TaxID=401053 RepID=E8V8I7_TERSS|nr:FKBP-type peptidyl-prolyl cis-trans isomerase [Terriglobus saanensis]ADV82966.1 peptidylprolyl isomerase FKBP-type [Terriglobus saanensis SP1PR4]
MRNLSVMFVMATCITSASFQGQTTSTPATTKPAKSKTTTTKTGTAASRARARTHTTVPAPPPVEGLAAVGEMPAVTGVPQTAYALKYVEITIGTGELALPHKYYTVHYTGWTTDGKKFDSSHDHPGGEPFVFAAGAKRVITGWDTGFEGMHVGGKRRLLVPYQLAYGEFGHPPVIPAKAQLIFDIEFLGQSDTPSDQTAPPAPAQK